MLPLRPLCHRQDGCELLKSKLGHEVADGDKNKQPKGKEGGPEGTGPEVGDEAKGHLALG